MMDFYPRGSVSLFVQGPAQRTSPFALKVTLSSPGFLQTTWTWSEPGMISTTGWLSIIVTPDFFEMSWKINLSLIAMKPGSYRKKIVISNTLSALILPLPIDDMART